jgi:hypothetical protein
VWTSVVTRGGLGDALRLTCVLIAVANCGRSTDRASVESGGEGPPAAAPPVPTGSPDGSRAAPSGTPHEIGEEPAPTDHDGRVSPGVAAPAPDADVRPVPAPAAQLRPQMAKAAWPHDGEGLSDDPGPVALRWPVEEVDVIGTFGWAIDPVHHVDVFHDALSLRVRDGTFVLSPLAGEVVRVAPLKGDGVHGDASAPLEAVALRRGPVEVTIEGRLAPLVLPGMRVETHAAIATAQGSGAIQLRITADDVALDPMPLLGVSEGDLDAVVAAALAAARADTRRAVRTE